MGTSSAAWEAAVGRFARQELQSAPIGDGWRRRIAYEIGRTPRLLRRVGASPPRSARGLRAVHLDALRAGLPWSPASLTLHFVALRRFAKWASNPLAADSRAWAVPSGSAGRRRWLARDQMLRLYRSAVGDEKVLLALEGFNGLRRIEVLRLRLKDLDFDRQRLRVLGKGRHGGKWRVLPMFSETARVLRPLAGRPDPESRVIPVSRSGADLILRRAANRAGFPEGGLRVSHHDLRRTFGRLAHKAGMDLVQLKNLYGHSSLDQTVHYIGLDEDEMRSGLERLAHFIGSVEPARGSGVR